MEFLTTVWENIQMVADTWVPVGEWLHHNQNIGHNMQILRRKIEDLKSREDDINMELTTIEHQRGKKRKREVENWLRNVQRKKTSVEQLEEEVNESNCLTRLRLGRLVEKNIQEVAELVEQGRFPEGLSIHLDQCRGEELLTSPLVGQNAQRSLEQIWKCLIDVGTSSIGVYGMGGVGKTAIVTHIHNLILDNARSFDYVYWVSVSQESSIYKMQSDIAKEARIDLFGEEDEMRRAARLFKCLKRRRKFVLILDDVWRAFSLVKVGIPLNFGGKLIITTRLLKVCRGLDCQQLFKIDPLSMEESWDLFTKILKSQRVIAQELERVMRSVAKECGGLPLAIITTATTMKGVEEVSAWRDALNGLREPVKEMIDVQQEVFRPLKFSYDRLEDERHQQCLLYCSLFPEGYKIPRNDLIVYWIADGLIEEMNSRRAQFERGNSIISRLIDSCLLESARNMRGESCVRMHDVIRDMTLSITRVKPMFVVKAGLQLTLLPGKRNWPENVECISLMENNLRGSFYCLSPNCPRLKTLMLQNNYQLYKLPNHLFVYMSSLSILDIRWLACLTQLPNSISNLTNLTVLLLRGCGSLKFVPSLAKLTKLQELDLSFTGLVELPHGTEKLTNLKFLDLSQMKLREVFPIGVLRMFSMLQCFRFHNPSVDVQLNELTSLRKLETLGITFPCINKLHSYVRTQHWRRLSHYYIQTGQQPGIIVNTDSNVVVIDNCSSIGPGEDFLLPEDLQELRIKRAHKLTSLLDILPALKEVKGLQKCVIDYSHGIESIWSMITTEEDINGDTTTFLKSLTVLHLRDLKNLRTLVDTKGFRFRPPKNGAFDNLQLLVIKDCGKLKHLFTPRLLQHFLKNLVQISVARCYNLEALIASEEQPFDEATENDNLNIILPKLQNIELTTLPKLNRISEGTLDFCFLQEIRVDRCRRLKKLPLSAHPANEQISATTSLNLKKIYGQKEWWDSLEWGHPSTKTILEPLFVEIPLPRSL